MVQRPCVVGWRDLLDSAIQLQMYDGPVLAAHPPLRLIRKTESKKRDRSNRCSLAPSKTGISRPIQRSSLADNPAFLSAREPDLQQISEPRTSTPAGQRLIHPVGTTIGCLKQCPGIADRPARHRIGKKDVE